MQLASKINQVVEVVNEHSNDLDITNPDSIPSQIDEINTDIVHLNEQVNPEWELVPISEIEDLISPYGILTRDIKIKYDISLNVLHENYVGEFMYYKGYQFNTNIRPILPFTTSMHGSNIMFLSFNGYFEWVFSNNSGARIDGLETVLYNTQDPIETNYVDEVITKQGNTDRGIHIYRKVITP